jgi:D-alanyl-D-alanine carboxypeptidase (penicillin-binding protein 5/6)
MRILSKVSLLVLLSFAWLSGTSGMAQQSAAEYAFVVDVETGVTLFEKNADVAMAPASMSKLMTVLMVFEAIHDGRVKLDEEFYVSDNAWRKGGAKSGGSTMFLKARSSVKVEDLLRGVIVQSGNDACIVLAEGIAGSEENFALAMTERATELGMLDSTFTNSTGWPDPGQMMSARDLATLALLLITEHSEYYSMFSERSFTWNGIRQGNRNPLLTLNIGADGLKTGHTSASGYGLVGSAEQNGRRIVMVINGLNSKSERRREAKSLMSWGFRSFSSEVILDGGQRVLDLPVWHGTSQRVDLVAPKQFKVLVPRSGRRSAVYTVTYDTPIRAPIAKGQKLATLRMTAKNTEPQQIDLVAKYDVERSGLFGRAFASFAYLLFGV